jgi:hypothetical protein
MPAAMPHDVTFHHPWDNADHVNPAVTAVATHRSIQRSFGRLPRYECWHRLVVQRTPTIEANESIPRATPSTTGKSIREDDATRIGDRIRLVRGEA